MVYNNPYRWYFDTPAYGISNPLSMVCQTYTYTYTYGMSYLWYIEPPTHGILTSHQPMAYRTPSTLKAPTHGILTPISIVF